MGCQWCSERVELIKGFCFPCHYMRIMEHMGYKGTFEEYENLSSDIESLMCFGYVLRDTVYLY
jgi:hypothetical protein